MQKEISLTEVLEAKGTKRKRLQSLYSRQRILETFNQFTLTSLVVSVDSVSKTNMLANVKILGVDSEGSLHFLTYHLAMASNHGYNDKKQTLKLHGFGTCRKFLLCEILANVLENEKYDANSLSRIAYWF